MRRPIIIYLWLGAISEAIILLMARGWARESLALLKYNQSQGDNVTITSTSEIAPTVSLVSMVIPLTLIGLALAGKLKKSKAALHALALSIFACAVISMWTHVVAYMPWRGGIIMGVNDPVTENKVSPELERATAIFASLLANKEAMQGFGEEPFELAAFKKKAIADVIIYTAVVPFEEDDLRAIVYFGDDAPPIVKLSILTSRILPNVSPRK